MANTLQSLLELFNSLAAAGQAHLANEQQRWAEHQQFVEHLNAAQNKVVICEFGENCETVYHTTVNTLTQDTNSMLFAWLASGRWNPEVSSCLAEDHLTCEVEGNQWDADGVPCESMFALSFEDCDGKIFRDILEWLRDPREDWGYGDDDENCSSVKHWTLILHEAKYFGLDELARLAEWKLARWHWWAEGIKVKRC
eukprot:TRINITY_DN67323_c5_g2_i1.p1 TRINITY_DN67323_c5_g2~~TRINITY_DN67323_c5_g2_i1.p1  ORF type:complete len:197 (-),score=18.48 TRINITY_DN67323_c5_g2_i1:516-1106(-)